MSNTELQRTELVVENTTEQGLGTLDAKNPTVLSCGGIFIPRPRPMGPNDSIYNILNCANDREPTKVVSGAFPRNVLMEVLHKESMN